MHDALLLCINVLLFLGKLAKFGNAYKEAIGRRKKKCMDGEKHWNIGNIGGFVNI